MNEIEKLKKIIEVHEDRISKLEKSFSNNKKGKPKEKKFTYEGVSGGVQMLIDNGFLDSPKPAKDVFNEMKREGYYNSLKNVDGSLRNVFVKKKVLQRIKEENVWKYVIRK